jgi:hypothetical protein
MGIKFFKILDRILCIMHLQIADTGIVVSKITSLCAAILLYDTEKAIALAVAIKCLVQ